MKIKMFVGLVFCSFVVFIAISLVNHRWMEVCSWTIGLFWFLNWAGACERLHEACNTLEKVETLMDSLMKDLTEFDDRISDLKKNGRTK